MLYVFLTTASLLKSSEAAVGDTSCDLATATTDCNAIQNSECDTGSSKCVCSNGFKEVLTDHCNTVLGDACKAGTAAAYCTGHVKNSACTNDIFSCAINYVEGNNICILALGQTCKADADCVSNANCDQTAGCTCNSGYISSGGLCIKAIGSTCSDTKACPSDMNLVCEGTNCVCADGYAERNDVCTLLRVSDTGCVKDAAGQCAGIDNAECDNAAQGAKCTCSDGFIEDSNDGSTCVKMRVSDKDCVKDAADQCIDNAECDNADSGAKCTCSDGYKEDFDDGSTCVESAKGNSAQFVAHAAGIITMSVIVIMFQKLF